MKLELDLWRELWERAGSQGLDVWHELPEMVDEDGKPGREISGLELDLDEGG